MSTVAGIDVSTHSVNIVLLDEETDAVPDHYEIDLHGDAWSSANLMRRIMPPSGAWNDVYLFGIEDPMSMGKGVAKKLGIITGAVLACLPALADVPILRMAPTEWKKETCGVPHAKKPEVAAWVGRTWPDIPALVTQDSLDAYAIAWAARAVNARAVAAA